MEMKFETIKREALREFFHSTNLNGYLFTADNPMYLALFQHAMRSSDSSDISVYATAEKWRDEGEKIINGWDVRRVGKLIELFPTSVPKKYHGRKLSCYMADNENCDWMVEFGEPDTERYEFNGREASLVDRPAIEIGKEYRFVSTIEGIDAAGIKPSLYTGQMVTVVERLEDAEVCDEDQEPEKMFSVRAGDGTVFAVFELEINDYYFDTGQYV